MHYFEKKSKSNRTKNIYICIYIFEFPGEFVPQEKTNPHMWTGANKVFKPKPYLEEIARTHNRKKRSLEEKTKRNDNLLKRERAKRRKLENMGIEFEFPGYVSTTLK